MKTITKFTFLLLFLGMGNFAFGQWASPGITTTASSPSVANGAPFLSMNSTGTGNRGFIMRKNSSTATGWIWQDGTDIIRISNSTSGFPPHIAIPNSGLVGFNTEAPTEELHIVGASTTADIRLEASGSKYLRFYEGTTQKGFVGHSGTSMILQNDEAAGEVEIDGQTGITLRVNNNTAIDVDANGLVTIDKASEALRLSGSSSYMSFYNGATYNGYLWHNNTNMYLNNNTATGNMYLGTGAGGIDMTIAADGDVGIGTTAPETKLHVHKGAGTYAGALGGIATLAVESSGFNTITMNGGNTWNGLVFADNTSEQYAGMYYNKGTDYIMFKTGGVDQRMTITSDGNIGIGTTAPTQQLDVRENARIGSGVGTGDAFVDIGSGRTANGNAYFKLVADASSYPAYGLRFIRLASTGESRIEHRGTAPMVFNAPDVGGNYSFKIGGASKVEFLGNACRPGIDGGINLGQNARRWAAVYAVNGIIQTSDKRLKKNIDKLDYGLAEIMRLKPVRYDWKDENALLGNKIGLIAQEVQEVISEVVYDEQLELVDNEDGTQEYKTIKSENMGMNYSELIPVLINGIQEQQVQISDKDERIETLETELASMKDVIAQIQAQLATKPSTTVATPTLTERDVTLNGEMNIAELAQNHPNPFNENTTITYFLPEGTTGAHMNIFSAEGKVLKTVKIDEVGQGQINLKANSLPAGNYMYQLVTDAGIVGSKSMVLAK